MKKKTILLVLAAVLVVLVGSCVTFFALNSEEQEQNVTLRATIVEISNSFFIVEPVAGSQELRSADRIFVSMEKMQSSPEPQVGDTLEIVYTGGIMETYPAQLQKIISIKLA